MTITKHSSSDLPTTGGRGDRSGSDAVVTGVGLMQWDRLNRQLPLKIIIKKCKTNSFQKFRLLH